MQHQRNMNAKEKAKELVDKFKNIDKRIYDINPDYFDLFILTQNEAKQCALIAVDEILNSRPTITDSQVEYNKYWNDVRSELQSF